MEKLSVELKVCYWQLICLLEQVLSLWTRDSALTCCGLQHGSWVLHSFLAKSHWIRITFVLLRRNSARFVVPILDSGALVFQSPSLLLSVSRWILGQWRGVEDCPAERSPRHLALHVGIVWRVVWVRGLYSLATVLFMTSATLFCCVHAHTHTQVNRILKTAEGIQLGIATFERKNQLQAFLLCSFYLYNLKIFLNSY